MPEQNEPATVTPTPSASDVPAPLSNNEIYSKVAQKISEAHNILIALSSNPSVDEMAAAIGLSLFLDKLGKRATAIYSGSTPNALEFLKPEDTFAPTADTLQDFVVALSKEKADHLRYKLDGDFVKIYITPYKTRISEEDLDFSYGDFNVDLVIALDVANGIDLDSALREHGRIMHNASVINITTGKPGKFGEIEWSDGKASSVSEMIAKLLYSLDSKEKISKEEATAFLTGIVAATDRFSNSKTTPETMTISSRLMESGANQQLISKNITPDVSNEHISSAEDPDLLEKNEDSENLDIKHDDEDEPEESEEIRKSTTAEEKPTTEENTKEEPTSKEEDVTPPEKDNALLEDLKAAEASLSHAGAEAMPDIKAAPIHLSSDSSTPPSDTLDISTEPSIETPTEDSTTPTESTEDSSAPAEPSTEPSADSSVTPIEPTPEPTTQAQPEPTVGPLSAEPEPTVGPISSEPESLQPEPTVGPLSAESESAQSESTVGPISAELESTTTESISTPESTPDGSDYLAGPEPSADSTTDSSVENIEVKSEENGTVIEERPEKVIQPAEGLSDELTNGGTDKYGKMLEEALSSVPDQAIPTQEISTTENPAMANAPAVPESPEINGVPEMNYMPMPGEEILPPPPAPAIDMGTTPPMPAMPTPTPASVVDTPPVAPPAEVTPIQPAISAPEPTPEPLGNQPAMQDQVYQPQANDPGAFKIPGM